MNDKKRKHLYQLLAQLNKCFLNTGYAIISKSLPFYYSISFHISQLNYECKNCKNYTNMKGALLCLTRLMTALMPT